MKHEATASTCESWGAAADSLAHLQLTEVATVEVAVTSSVITLCAWLSLSPQIIYTYDSTRAVVTLAGEVASLLRALRHMDRAKI